MKITKFGHCCLLIEEKELRILTDPGSFSTLQNGVENIDVITITHEHQDHFHIESIKQILSRSTPLIITNSSVAKLLDVEGITGVQIVEDGQQFEHMGLTFTGYGKEHAEIFENYGQVMNTGYFIGNRLYYPGDSFFVPDVSVDVLALPLGGGWCNMSDTLHFALKVNPKIAFPVHDAMYNEIGIGLTRRTATKVLTESKISFIDLPIGVATEL